MYKFKDLKWYTDNNGNKIPVYAGLDINMCLKVREHYRRIQSIVDTYKENYKTGINMIMIDKYSYTFIVKKNTRKVKLIEVEYDE